MVEMPLLSVVVPIYGVEEYLSECIESLINQTYKNLEIILVDDGATGKEPQICDAYAMRDKRIQVIHKKNAGLVAARKTGIQVASAKYITFVDGDDYVGQSYYTKMMQHIVNDFADVVISEFASGEISRKHICSQHIPDGVYEGNSLIQLRKNMNCYNEKYFEFGISPSVGIKVFKKDILQKYIYDIPESIRLGEDAAITFPFIFLCKKVVIDNSIQEYFYRRVEGSMSQKKDAHFVESSSSLYDFLKPFYYQHKDENLVTQLEMYRAYLLDTGMATYMYGRRIIPMVTNARELVDMQKQGSSVEHLDRIFDSNISLLLKRQICLLMSKRYVSLAIVTYIRKVVIFIKVRYL